MGDVLNDYFRQFYPDDYATNWEMEPVGAYSYGRHYKGGDGSRRQTIFPAVVCADGFSMSCQGHAGAYCYPQGDFEESYRSVEVWRLSAPEPLLAEYGDGSTPLGHVPVHVVCAVIEKHGGLRVAPSPDEVAE